MGRKPAPRPLELSDPPARGERRERDYDGQQPQPWAETLQIASPATSRSSKSPRSPFMSTPKKAQAGGQPMHIAELVQQQQQQPLPQDESQSQSQSQSQQHRLPSAAHMSYDEQQQQQQQQQQHALGHSHHRKEHKGSKSGFFSTFNKSANRATNDRLHSSDSRSDVMSRGNGNSNSQGLIVATQSPKQSDLSQPETALQKHVTSFPSKSDVSLASSADHEPASSSAAKTRAKPKPFHLGRSRSTRDRDHQCLDQPARAPHAEPERGQALPPKTAPIGHDRAFRDMMSSTHRNHSADRAQLRDAPAPRDSHHNRDHLRIHPAAGREAGGSAFFSGLRSSSSRAADMISKGLFGKSGRSGSTTERELAPVDDEHYVLKTINLPLVEQTRKTRISKRLEDSRDKTEFWMPAFPWRAIDFLNYKGTDVEGLYRVPGSGPQVKKWQRRFDEEYDIDLFAQADLYDINIVGSMLKAWLRELPDELFPKEAQDRVARECAGSEKVPQLLIDELSNLSPFNYYLLFAITCHLSLLLAHTDKNKMDFRNLCICFQPCMKIDAFCFKFLVCDWRDCWKGCKTEARYIEEEYMLFNQSPPLGAGDARRHEPAGQEEHAVSSSGSSKKSNHHADQHARLKKMPAPQNENGSAVSSATGSPAMSTHSGRETPPNPSRDLRPLSPIKPLSPLGFQ